LIFLANEVTQQKKGGQELLGGLNCVVERNHFGAQINSFEYDLHVSELGTDPIRAIFIRAPVVVRTGDNVKILAELADHQIVAVVQDNILGTSFHPELTKDTRWHKYFVDMVQKHKDQRK